MFNHVFARSPNIRINSRIAPVSFSADHALRMRIANMKTAKMIAPKIVHIAIISLIIVVPFLPATQLLLM